MGRALQEGQGEELRSRKQDNGRIKLVLKIQRTGCY